MKAAGRDPYDAARALAELEEYLPPGAALIPLRSREKRPALAGWTRIDASWLARADFRALFVGDAGIGLLCGRMSGGLCMVDVDRDELVELAEAACPVLAQSPRVHGHRGAKWLVRCEGPVPGFALNNRTNVRLGEFLGDSQQGVLAGIHPLSGLAYRWHRRGEILVVQPPAILESLRRLEVRGND